MSIFETLQTDPQHRRTLFWLVCINIRLLIASAFTFFVLYGNSWVAYVVGGIGIGGGLGFWYQSVYDNQETIWWYRRVHSVIWVGGGLSSILLRRFRGPDDAAIAVGAFFYSDVVFGVLTASCLRTSWMPKFSESSDKRWFLLNRETLVRFLDFSGATVWASDDSKNGIFTAWSFVHLILTVGMGAVAYFILPSDPWVPCIFLSFLILGWEAFENVNLGLKKHFFGVGIIDSDANLLSDILVGFSGLWGTAYILKASVD